MFSRQEGEGRKLSHAAQDRESQRTVVCAVSEIEKRHLSLYVVGLCKKVTSPPALTSSSTNLHTDGTRSS